MKGVLCFLAAVAFFSCNAAAMEGEKNMATTRRERAAETYEMLFAQKQTPSSTNPELMEILQNVIFGEVFHIGDLDHKMRELITVSVLSAMQTLPQLKAHIHAALNVGNTPLEVRETIYGCAPLIGFPRTLNAVGVFDEVMKERGIPLPLEKSASVNEENRHEKGTEIQNALYGDEVKKAMRSLPEGYRNAVPDLLTDFCFGDFYTRKGLSVKQRELLSLTVLAALGAEKQIGAHIVGNLKAGNDKNVMLAAMVQALPYIGFPNALSAINLIKTAEVEKYRPIYDN